MREKPKAYLAGGDIGSLAAAAFIIRDGNRPGEHISLLQATPMMGAEIWTGHGEPVQIDSLITQLKHNDIRQNRGIQCDAIIKAFM